MDHMRRRWSLCDKCQLEVIDDAIDHRIVGDEGDNPHLSTALRADQRVDFKNLADPKKYLWVFCCLIFLLGVSHPYSTTPESGNQLHSRLKSLHLEKYLGIQYTGHKPNANHEALEATRIIPLSGWNFIYVPYCDGSVHMGDNQVDTDGDGRPDRWYWGLRGTSAAIALMKELYPNPEKILISGNSAGGLRGEWGFGSGMARTSRQ